MADRKARLKALATKAGRADQEEPATTSDGDDDEDKSSKSITFRNYMPQDSSLEPTVDSRTSDESEEPPLKRPRTKDENDEKTALQHALEEAQRDVRQQPDPSNITAPKKINWDLKRDIQDKLDKLERRTQRAIVSLLRERLEREAAEEADEEEDLD